MTGEGRVQAVPASNSETNSGRSRTADAHLWPTDEDGQRYHSSACWCWRRRLDPENGLLIDTSAAASRQPQSCTRCGHEHRPTWGHGATREYLGPCNHLSMSGGFAGMQQRCACLSPRFDPPVPHPVDGSPQENGQVFVFNTAPDPYRDDS